MAAPSNYISLPNRGGGGPSTQTFEGVPGGMNVAIPAQELDDTQARYLQDILLDTPGLVRRRGPLSNTNGFPNTADKAQGIASTIDPLGNTRLGVLSGANFSLLNSAFTAIAGNFAWNGTLGTAPYPLVDIKPALGQGVWIGTSTQYDANAPTQSLALWRGGISPNYTTGTITATRGNATVTGSGTAWLANATPGMFLFANTDDPFTNTLVGVVQNVVSDTSITLEQVSPYPITAKTYTLQSVRGFQQRVTVGSITCATTGTAVTGANTKFITQLSTGTWNLYRATDLTWIGKVASIQNNSGLTLAANAAINMNNENYIALRGDGSWGLATASGKVGFLNATYASLQWFANNAASPTTTSRVWFSDVANGEDVDMSTFDGNYIDVSSSANYTGPITGMAPAYNALLVFKESETFGIFGNSPSTFSVQKIEDDGALCTGSIQSYGGGVLWAGRTGIFQYDGVQTTNIVAGTLGQWYRELVRTINPKINRMWSMMARDHYFLFLEQANPTVPVVKGNTSTSASHLTIVINMITHAVTIFTNFAIRGGVQMPFNTGLETVLVSNGNDNVGHLFSTVNVFEGTGNDGITSDVDFAAGPDFYIETKKYNGGDSLILKLWSQLIVNYNLAGDALKVDTVVGLNNIGATSTTTLTPTIYTWDSLKANYNTWDFLKFSFSTWSSILTTVFKPKRVRFLKRSQNFAFRLWQNSSSVSQVQIGPFQIGYKQMRPGRI